MKRLDAVSADDYRALLCALPSSGRLSSAEAAAQAVIDTLYEALSASLVLLRLFMTVPYRQLPAADRQFVDQRGIATGTAAMIGADTPIFTLLGTRGRQVDWNDRRRSQHFRCIPLASSAFVASLPMLSMQLTSVGFDLKDIDRWQSAVTAAGRADGYRGMLYIRAAGTARDGQGRMIVPKQEFVAAHGIGTVLGFGSGYCRHPALVTLFAFTDATYEQPAVAPLAAALEVYIETTAALVGSGRIFADR